MAAVRWQRCSGSLGHLCIKLEPVEGIRIFTGPTARLRPVSTLNHMQAPPIVDLHESREEMTSPRTAPVPARRQGLNESLLTRLGRPLRRLLPAVTTTNEELLPDESYIASVARAAEDIRLCGDLFDGWAARLDELYKNKEGRLLRQQLDKIKDDLALAMQASSSIISCRADFAGLMAQRIHDALASRAIELEPSTETSRLAEEIGEASRALSQHVNSMQQNLASFVSTLEGLNAKGTRQLKTRILRWLKYLFNALAVVFSGLAVAGSFLGLSVPGATLVASFAAAGSNLSTAISAICSNMEERSRKKEESFNDVLDLLKKTVPQEAQKAQEYLRNFDEAHIMLKMEAVMQTGRRVVVRGPGTAEVSPKWRGAEKVYRALLQPRALRVS
ncbi:hypothetical protein BC834DRAFT_77374 [Gloeopeniophorella convolvens]|nr:hypothetical protein BC834DRAFT_77374 [Gloeopeniophorella convolvens]